MNAAFAPNSVGRAELVFTLGVGLILVSGLLPWIGASEPIPVTDPSEQAEGLNSFGEDSTSERILGIDRVDWVVLAGVGLVATFLVVTEPWSQIVLAVAGASAVAAIGLGAAYFVDPAWMYSEWIKSEVAAVAEPEPGVYLAIGGGLCQAGGWYLGYSGAESSGAQRLDAPAQAGGGGAARGPPDQSQGPRQGQPDGRQPPQQRSQPGRQQSPPQQRRPPQGGQRPPEKTGQEQPPSDRQPPNGQPPQNQSSGHPPRDRQPPVESGQPQPEDSSPPTAADTRERTESGQPSSGQQGDSAVTPEEQTDQNDSPPEDADGQSEQSSDR